jgi:hypothetical protein
MNRIKTDRVTTLVRSKVVDMDDCKRVVVRVAAGSANAYLENFKIQAGTELDIFNPDGKLLEGTFSLTFDGSPVDVSIMTFH